MKQWSMRISAYAQRLLDGLENLDWPQPLKDAQTNWIGRSVGAMVEFRVCNSGDVDKISVFTTRPDTIFGVSFMTLAPEHELVSKITTDEYKGAVEKYVLKYLWTIYRCLCGTSIYWRIHTNLDWRLRVGELWNRSCYGSTLWRPT
jgi:leucyl-tRNA synthetase